MYDFVIPSFYNQIGMVCYSVLTPELVDSLTSEFFHVYMTHSDRNR